MERDYKMTAKKSKWEEVVERENALAELEGTLSLKALIIEYEKEWAKTPWYFKLLESKKRLCERLFLAGSVAGMTQLLKTAEARMKEKK